jgi:hypothetical protein
MRGSGFDRRNDLRSLSGCFFFAFLQSPDGIHLSATKKSVVFQAFFAILRANCVRPARR